MRAMAIRNAIRRNMPGCLYSAALPLASAGAAASDALSWVSTEASARSTASRACTLARKSCAASCAGAGSVLRLLQNVGEAILVQRGLHARDDRLDALVVGAVARLAHAHDRLGAGEQAVDDRGVGGLLFGVDDLEGDRLELRAQLGRRRHAVEGEALERREVDVGAGHLARLLQLGRVGVAAVDGALQVGELQRQHDALGGGAAIALALDDALHVLLQRRQLAADRLDGGGDILGLGEGGEARIEIGLEALELLLRGLEAGRRAVAVGLQGGEPGRHLGALGLQGRELAVHALRARARGLARLGGRGQSRVSISWATLLRSASS